jgi:hypothetical protein
LLEPEQTRVVSIKVQRTKTKTCIKRRLRWALPVAVRLEV